jgi:hypothetical protein
MPLVDCAVRGFFAPVKTGAAWRTTSANVARNARLGRDSVQRRENVTSDGVQSRLRWSGKDARPG